METKLVLQVLNLYIIGHLLIRVNEYVDKITCKGIDLIHELQGTYTLNTKPVY